MLLTHLTLLQLLPLLGAAMLGTSVTETDADEPPGPGEGDFPDDLARAGADYLAGLTPEQREQDLAPGLEIDDAGHVEETGRGAPAPKPKRGEEEAPPARGERERGERRGEERAGEELEEEVEHAATDADQEVPSGHHRDQRGQLVRDKDGAVWNPAIERYQMPASGKLAEGEAPAGTERAAAKKGDGEPIKITLPGIRDRGEEDLELEVDDPDIAARLQRMQSEAWRRVDYRKRLSGLQAREERLEEAQAMMETDAVGFVMEHMPVEEQLKAARALVLEHLAVLGPEVDELLADPAKVNERLRTSQKTRDEGRQALERKRGIQRFTRSCIEAAGDLIPDGTDQETEREFMGYASTAMSRAAQGGQLRRPQDVKQVLASLVKRFGFDRPAAARGVREAPAAAASTRTPPKREQPPAARPVSDRAREVAARGDTRAPVRGVRRLQSDRAAARRVAPPGAGAAPVQVPVIPDDLSVEDVGKHLAKNGRLPTSWTPSE